MYVNCGNGEYLNCRETASMQASIKYYLPHGEKVTTSSVSGDWTKITPADYSSKGTAWVKTIFLNSTKPATYHNTKLSALGDKTLQLGRFGRYVYNLQIGLGITADGDFGSGTENAVRTFQGNNGLVIDGYAGDNTKEKLWQQKSGIITSNGK